MQVMLSIEWAVEDVSDAIKFQRVFIECVNGWKCCAIGCDKKGTYICSRCDKTMCITHNTNTRVFGEPICTVCREME